MFYVYVLESYQNNSLYVGSTRDLKTRFKIHNEGKVFSTRNYRPWKLIYYEAYSDEQLARMREQKLKHHGNALRQLKQRIKLSAGFTVVELIVVVALLLIIGTFSTAFYSRLYTQSTVTSVTDQLTQSFRKAQSYAMNSRLNSNWGVHNGTSQITLFQGNTYAGRNTVLDENFSVNGNIVVTGFSDIIFSRLTGTPSATVTITVVGNDNTKTITINSQGVISR